MLTLIGLAINLMVGLAAFIVSRRFVENRLRFVDAVQRPYAAVVAGAGAGLLMLSLAWVPLISGLTAVLVGTGVFAGVASGAREIRRRIGA